MTKRVFMKVYMIRHGQSIANFKHEMAGWAQVPLSELGFQQARALSPYLRDIRFDMVFSSDLLRAIQTAREALPDYIPILSSNIREISVGSLSGRSRIQCLEQYGDQFVASDLNQDFSAYGGEDQKMICGRVFEFIQELEALEDVDNVAVFGHEGTVHQMLNYVFRTHLEISSLKVANASVTVFDYIEGNWRLVAFSFTGSI